jgi:D-alanyl-D-alanine carboxypeptidase (penicillin-binding protein 5/6)
VIKNARLWKGRKNSVELKLEDSLNFTSPLSRSEKMWSEVVIPQPLIAPVTEGQFAGYLVLYDEYGEINRVPLFAAKSYIRGNVFKRFIHSIGLLFKR